MPPCGAAEFSAFIDSPPQDVKYFTERRVRLIVIYKIESMSHMSQCGYMIGALQGVGTWVREQGNKGVMVNWRRQLTVDQNSRTQYIDHRR